MNFAKTTYKPLGGPIAQVNRVTRELFIDPDKFNALRSDQHRLYVLLHEAGHIDLNTADEYLANQYAVKKFMPVGELTNEEFGRRILVLSDIQKIDTTPLNGELSYFIGYILQAFGFAKSKADASQAASQAQFSNTIGTIQNRYTTATEATANKTYILLGAVFFLLLTLVFIYKKFV